MSEKLTRKEKIKRQKEEALVSSGKVAKKTARRSINKWLGLIVALTGIVLYAGTIQYNFVLDDFGLIKENSQTKQGISAVPEIFKSSYRFGMNTTDYQLYRPLTKAMFAIEWSIAPDTPALGHTINILLYGLLCYVLFSVTSLYMKGALLIPFLASIIFAVHPLHSEVVANIKGRDELVTLLLCMTSVGLLHSYVTKNSLKAFGAAMAIFFVSLFAKESTLTFIAVVPLFYYFFTNASRSKYIFSILGMGICAAIFLLIRSSVLGKVITMIPVEDNSLAGIKDIIIQKANAIYILGVYLKLLVYPAPLIADGSFNHFPVIGIADWKFIVPAVILVASAVYAVLFFKRKDTISFAILYFFATASIVSNIFVLIGTNYGERLMFIPSFGFCLVVAALIARGLKMTTESPAYGGMKSFFVYNKKPVIVVLFIVLAFGARTLARSPDWKSDYTLYSHDVKNVPNSAHMLFYYANHITSEEFLAALPDDTARNKIRREAIDYLSRSVKIYPKYADGYQRRGFIYYQMGYNLEAETDYKSALLYNPTHPIVYNNYGTLCFNQRRYNDAMTYFKEAIRYNPRYAHALNNLASVYGVFGQGEAEMITKDPSNGQKHSEQSRQNFETAIDYFRKSIDVDPEFVEPYRLIAVTYRHLGNNSEGERYENLAKKITEQKNAKN